MPNSPSYSLGELGQRLGFAVPADAAALPITGIQSLEDAAPGDLSFLGNPRYLPQCRVTQATAVLVPLEFADAIPAIPLPVENPSLLFARVIEQFRPPEPEAFPGIHPSAVIHPRATIAPEACIGPCVVIEAEASVGAGSVLMANNYLGRGARIGTHCRLHPGVVIREHSIIGNRVVLHAGVVIGGDGFGYEFSEGRQQKIPQVGIVQIDDDVEVGANSCIDRARFGRTWIQQGAKIDNLVQIGHNVVVGPHAIIVSQTGIAGSVKIGAYAVLAGQCGIVGHITIGEQAVIAARSGISKDVPPGATMWGSPATPIREAKERLVQVARLPKLLDRVKALEAKLAALESPPPTP